MTTDMEQVNLVENEYFNMVYEDNLSMMMMMDNFSNMSSTEESWDATMDM